MNSFESLSRNLRLSSPPGTGRRDGFATADVPASAVGRRLVAGLIDTSLVILLALGIFYLRGPTWFFLLRRPIAVLVPTILFLIRDSIQGRSPGKLVMQLVVYSPACGEAIGFARSAYRNLPLVLPIVGPLVFAPVVALQILSGKRRRWGDGFAGTIVLTEEQLEAQP